MHLSVFIYLFLLLFLKVESATEATMTKMTEDILNCGYNGPVNVEKEEIVR